MCIRIMTLIRLASSTSTSTCSPLQILEVTTSASWSLNDMVGRTRAGKSTIWYLTKMTSTHTTVTSSIRRTLEPRLYLLWRTLILLSIWIELPMGSVVRWRIAILSEWWRVCVHWMPKTSAQISAEEKNCLTLFDLGSVDHPIHLDHDYMANQIVVIHDAKRWVS